LVSNVELVWESEQWARVCRHGGEHHQVVMIDKRGSALSDRVPDPPSQEVRVTDTLAVMDAEDIVNIPARVQSHAGAGQVLASDTSRGSSMSFDDIGPHELKGLDGDRRLYALHRGQA
jgi:hypothetical protein